jgi:deoxyhypusine synthase
MITSFASTGAQASSLAKAIEIVNKMRKEKAFIYLGYTSNMVTTGNREIIKYSVLIENKEWSELCDIIKGTKWRISWK